MQKTGQEKEQTTNHIDVVQQKQNNKKRVFYKNIMFRVRLETEAPLEEDDDLDDAFFCEEIFNEILLNKIKNIDCAEFIDIHENKIILRDVENHKDIPYDIGSETDIYIIKNSDAEALLEIG